MALPVCTMTQSDDDDDGQVDTIDDLLSQDADCVNDGMDVSVVDVCGCVSVGRCEWYMCVCQVVSFLPLKLT